MRLRVRLTAWVPNGQDQRTADTGMRVAGSMPYVTRTHNIKFGVPFSFGPVHVYTDCQADLVQKYTNSRPTTVTVYTTPNNRFSMSTTTSGFTRRIPGRSSA